MRKAGQTHNEADVGMSAGSHKQSTAKIAKTAIIITKIRKNYSQFHCNNPWHSTEMTADT